MKLRRYILRALLLSFCFSVMGMLFIALPGIAVGAVHKLPNTDTVLILKYLPIVVQGLAPYIMPISYLLAVVTTYGRLAADREWIAIQMAGFRPLGMLLPAFWMALFLGAVTFWMVGTELPLLKKRQRQFLIAAAHSALTDIPPGKTEIQLGDFFLKGAFRDPNSTVFRDVIIYKPGEDGEPPTRVRARTASFREVDEVWYVDLTDVQPLGSDISSVGRMASVRIRIPIREMIDKESRSYQGRRYKTNSDLWTELQNPRLGIKDRRGNIYELHRRISMGASFFLYLLLGAPTGLLLRKGTQLGALAIAVGYALLFHIFSMRVGKELGLSNQVHPAVGAWITTAVGAAFGIFLLTKARKR